MTANEQRNLFKELYDGASAQEMGFDDTEVSRFLNLAQNIIFDEKYYSNRNSLKEGFEMSNKRDGELNNLKRNLTLWYDNVTSKWVMKDLEATISSDVEIINDNIMDDDSILFRLPYNVMYIIRDNVDMKYNDLLYRNINVKNLNEDELNNVLNNPFRKPDITVIYRTNLKFDLEEEDANGRLIRLYLPENSEFYRWNCSYIKRPRSIVVDIFNPLNQVDCELGEIVHKDIVIKAVELAMGSIGSQKIQSAIYNSNKNIN